MIMKRLLHITQRMLVIALCLCAAGQVNAITIKVQKGGTAPYLYAYLGSGDGATKLTGDWPGTQFTEKEGNYWMMEIQGQSTINMILNNGSGGDGNQTADYLNISGVNGVASFIYDGHSTMFGTMPNATFSASEIYFTNPPSWGTPNAIARTTGGGYGKKAMVLVGTDGSGLSVYKTSFSEWNDTPNTIEFTDDSNPSTGQLTYTAGGYYNTSKVVATFTDLNSVISDENFRNAITASTGISGAFCPSNITVLDVSNSNITSLSGIELFTNLIELNASHNALTTADLGNNANLEVLNLSHNSALRGFNSNYTSNSNYINLATNNTNLKELYLSDCSIG